MSLSARKPGGRTAFVEKRSHPGAGNHLMVARRGRLAARDAAHLVREPRAVIRAFVYRKVAVNPL